MDPLRTMSLKELRRVLRLASRMRERDRARQEEERLREEYLRAAAEIGLTDDYLHRAARQVRQEQERRLRTACVVTGLAAMTGMVALFTFTMLTALRPAPAVLPQALVYPPVPPAPRIVEPLDATVILTPNPPIALGWRERIGPGLAAPMEGEFRWRPRRRGGAYLAPRSHAEEFRRPGWEAAPGDE